LVEIDLDRSTAAQPVFTHREGDLRGQPITVEEIESRWGSQLREDMGIRFLPKERMAGHIPTDIGAPLAHRLESPYGEGSLKERLGLLFDNFAGSNLEPMKEQFQDNDLGPGLQTLLFLSAAGSLAALPEPLHQILPHAFRFQVAAACCFPGLDSDDALNL